MYYDYLVVGSGLYGAIFAHEAKKSGKSVLVLQEMFIQKKLKESTYINTVRIFSIQIIRKYGIISHSLRNSTVLQTVRLRTIKGSFTAFRLTCTHLTKCGVW